MIKVKPLDWIILSLALCLVAVISVPVFFNRGDAGYVHIKNGTEEWFFPLDKESIHNVKGLIGYSVIQVRNHKAAFIESTCPEKICVTAGPVSKSGEWVACLPNGILITIKSGNKKEIDGMAY